MSPSEQATKKGADCFILPNPCQARDHTKDASPNGRKNPPNLAFPIIGAPPAT
jgi:hypothetical protein